MWIYFKVLCSLDPLNRSRFQSMDLMKLLSQYIQCFSIEPLVLNRILELYNINKIVIK